MLRNWPILLLATVLVVIIGVSCYTDSSYQDKQDGTGNSSSSVNVAQNETSHSSQETQTTKHPPRGWRKLFVWPEGVAALAIVLTLLFIAWQAMLMRQTILSSEDSSKRELRAYLAVVIGPAFFQDRQTNTVFEADPLLINTGRTPAHKINFTVRAAIKPHPLPSNADLPETGDVGIGETVLGVQQNGTMRGVVEGFQADERVQQIKDGSNEFGLYVWGVVRYHDVFGDEHHTRFCQHIYWDGAGNVRGTYTPGRNDAT